MRILGLDVGDKRIGIAVSDEMGLIAQGLTTLVRTDLERDIKQLMELLEETGSERVVVGLPKNMNGTLGPQALKVQQFIDCLQQRRETPLEIIYWDERLTTVAAERMLISGDISRKKRKKVVDKVAAVLILQAYLDKIYSK